MYNPENDSIFMIAADLSGGEVELWPNMLNARVYNSFDEAHAEAKSITKRSVENKFYTARSVTDVLKDMGRGHPQYSVVVTAAQMHLDKRAASDNDMDTDNDGKISVGELEKELQDIRDDLVDLSDLPWAIPDKDDRNIRYYMERLADEAGFTAKEFVNQDSDIEIGQLDALVDGFVEDESMGYKIGDDESGTISVGTFKGDHVAVATPAKGYQTWMR